MKTSFSDMKQVFDYVATALSDMTDSFDVESIAYELTEWEDGKLVITKNESEFWKIVEKHNTSN